MDLARKLYPNQDGDQKRWTMRHQDKLDNGKIERLVASLRSIDAATPEWGKIIQSETAYFQKNAERMRYKELLLSVLERKHEGPAHLQLGKEGVTPPHSNAAALSQKTGNDY